MKKILLLLFLGISCLRAQPQIYSNRFTSVPDGSLIDGSVLFNLPPTPVDNEFNVIRDFGAVGDNVTDDTAAFQNAINYIVTNRPAGATLYVPIPPVKYLIAGPIQDVSGAKAQLVIPVIPGQPSRAMTIRIRGPVMQAHAMYILSSGGAANGAATLRSSLTGADGQSVIATYMPSAIFNSVTVDMENINIEMPVNPTMSGLNFRNAYALRLRAVRVWTGVSPFDVASAPWHTASFGICTPKNNNAAFTRLDDCSVVGMYNGYEISEHTTGDNNVAFACTQAISVPASYHSSYLGRFGIYHCQYGIGFYGASRLKIAQLDFEHATSGWKASVADVYDPTGFGSGDIDWSVISQNVGVTHVLNVTGGANLRLREIGSVATGGGSGSYTGFTLGSGVPTFTPTVIPAQYINTNGGAVYFYYSGAWH